MFRRSGRHHAQGAEDTFKDPDFIADANRMALGVNLPRTVRQIKKCWTMPTHAA